jgi:hypothetical protein
MQSQDEAIGARCKSSNEAMRGDSSVLKAHAVPPPAGPLLCPSEGAAAPAATATSASALLAGHLLRNGELVLLLLRPSKWFILLSGIKFLAAVAIVTALAVIFRDKLHYLLNQPAHSIVEVGIFAMAGRLMWAVLQWMGRLYVLTDLRILSLSGVFSVEVFDCPLRRVARTLLEATFKEQVCRIGSITIIPQDEHLPMGNWRMVGRPRQVHEKILATIARAKQ